MAFHYPSSRSTIELSTRCGWSSGHSRAPLVAAPPRCVHWRPAAVPRLPTSRHHALGFLFVALLALIGSPGALACATCFGRSESPLAEGMNMGILVLLGFILTVLAAFATFFVFLARTCLRTMNQRFPGLPGPFVFSISTWRKRL